MNKNETIVNNIMSISKAKSKRAKIRSKMLKMIMPLLSRETGEKLAKAIDKKNVGLFNSVWKQIQNIIDDKLESTSSDDLQTLIYNDMDVFNLLASDSNKPTRIEALCSELAIDNEVCFKGPEGFVSVSVDSVISDKGETELTYTTVSLSNNKTETRTVKNDTKSCYLSAILQTQ